MTRFARLALRLIRRGFLILLIMVPGLSAIMVVQYRYTFAEAVPALSLGPCPDRGARRDHRRAGGGRRGGHRHRHRLSGCQPAADRGACRCAERGASGGAVSRRCSGCDRLGASRRPGAGGGAGGFLLTVLVDAFDGPNWLAQLSPFAHLAWCRRRPQTGLALPE